MRLALSSLLICALPLALAAQTGTVTGTVRDSAGLPVPFAQIFVVGTAYSALADSHGRFFIRRLPAGTVRIRGAFVGHRPVIRDSVPVHPGGVTEFDLVLLPAHGGLEAAAVYCECPQVERDLNTTRWTITPAMLGR